MRLGKMDPELRGFVWGNLSGIIIGMAIVGYLVWAFKAA